MTLPPGTATNRCFGNSTVMARYNIEVRTESHVRETTSIDMSDLTKLRVEVACFVGELLKDHARQIWVDEDWQVDVTNERGLILFVMHVSARNTPATPVMQQESSS